jgi:hypothetical protein
VKSDEYLEEVLKDAFERELDVDENVARTLPFFAASLALAATLYGYIAAQMPPLAWTLLSVLLHVLLVAAAACAAGLLWRLFQVVRVREYRIPPKETEQIEWAEALRGHFKTQQLTPATVEKKVVEELRKRMISEYAESALHNRAANAEKLKARAAGFTLFVVMLAIAFLMIGIIFVFKRLPEPPRQDPTHGASSETSAALLPTSRQGPAAAAKAAGGSVGREVPRRAGGQHGGPGQEVTSKPPPGAPAGGAPAPTPQPAQSIPPPPQHQILKKTDETGGPLQKRGD